MLLPQEIPIPEVERLLGVASDMVTRLPTGGQKQVFRVDMVDRQVVVKFVQISFRIVGESEYKFYDSITTRTMRELNLMREYSSPYLPELDKAIYDEEYVHENAQFIVFAEKYIGATSVRDLIISGRSTPSVAIAIVKDISEAIDLYWTKGRIIHRDIKPENIVRSDITGKYVLIDSGVHYSPENASITSGVIGTPPYLSPEQALGQRKDLDSRSDLYCLGLVTYEVITGSHPYFDLTTISSLLEEELRDIIVNVKPKVFAEYEGLVLEEWLADIVNSLLSKQKFYRPRNPRKLIEIIEGAEA